METDIPDIVLTLLSAIATGTKHLTHASDTTGTGPALRTLLAELDTAARVDPSLEPTPDLIMHILSFYKATQLRCKTLLTPAIIERLRDASKTEEDQTVSQIIAEVFDIPETTEVAEGWSAQDILDDECREAAVLDFIAALEEP